MKITCHLSRSLITTILWDQCGSIENLFDNNLEPSREQIEDLGEIIRAWLSSDPVRVPVAASAPEPGASDPTPGAKPEPDEDPFRHYVRPEASHG